MRKQLFILFIFLFGGLVLPAQSRMGPALQQALKDAPGLTQRVVIVFAKQANAPELREKVAGLPAPDRARKVTRELRRIADESQKSLLEDIGSQNLKIKLVKSLYAVNLWVADAPTKTLSYLSEYPGIDYLELESAWKLPPASFPRFTPEIERSPGGAENGLRAVNAPALWKMGYSGKGRIAYNMDTGVWTEHPSIGDRFMGNFFPLSQTWNGFDFPTPMDKPGSHGTHTLGTQLGLEKATDDTVGMAPNARWIACDVVATSLATVHPLTDFALAFEWALNPDGDTATVSDIPDVINNSWGFLPPTDTSLCTSYMSILFDNLEAAGIAVVFSAGNDGPGPMTVTYPQHISNSLTTTFTVAAVNGNDTAHTVASFSSRGPTICPRTGSLLIKPEVSAPGVSVRSALGKDGYGLASGTSMAAPHVSGAVLLLREAFPNVSGDEILLALYFSAKDLGIAGEDNTYGMGMIDVLAAYNLLAQTHTPTPPVTAQNDLSISQVISPSVSFLCDEVLEPEIEIQNNGLQNINSILIEYGLNSGNWQQQAWAGTLTPGQSDTVVLSPQVLSQTGENEIFIRVSDGNFSSEPDTINNRRYIRFRKEPQTMAPFSEDFEAGGLFGGNWYVENADNEISWDTITVPGKNNSTHCVWLNLAAYSPPVLQEDGLISPEILLPDSGNVTLYFDLAYQHRHNVLSDSFKVLLSFDCGQTWPEEIWYEGGADLSTHDTVAQNWFPVREDQWESHTADLTNYTGMGYVLVKFVGINDRGNNLFLDNIQLLEGPPVGRAEPILPEISVYPNPGSDQLVVRAKDKRIESIRVFDLQGKQVLSQYRISGQKAELRTQNLPSGAYFIEVRTSAGTAHAKWVKL